MSVSLHTFDAGKEDATVWWTGDLFVPPDELREALRGQVGRRDIDQVIDGWFWTAHPADGHVLLTAKPNLVTNTGIDRTAQRLFGIGGPPGAVDSMGVDNGTVNPSASTAQSADGNSTSRTILAFDSTATYSRPDITCLRTFTQATVAFIMKRLFLNASTTDASGNLHSMTNVFTLDPSGFSTWTQIFTGKRTGTGS